MRNTTGLPVEYAHLAATELKMTKKEIIAELKMFGINATLRPRKSTLEALLKEKREDAIKEDMAKQAMLPKVPDIDDPLIPVWVWAPSIILILFVASIIYINN